MSRRAAYAIVAIIVVLLVAAQIVMPRVASDRVADRLTAGGGTATASVSAFPAARLLFGEGDSLNATGSGLNLQLTSSDSRGFERLDGFGNVSVHVTRSRAGPFRIEDFALTRTSSGPYHLVAHAITSPHDLLAFGADRLGFIGGLALRFGGATALGDEASARLPVRLDMELQSDGGNVVVIAGSGTIDGIPTGPLAELITSAIAIRL